MILDLKQIYGIAHTYILNEKKTSFETWAPLVSHGNEKACFQGIWSKNCSAMSIFLWFASHASYIYEITNNNINIFVQLANKYNYNNLATFVENYSAIVKNQFKLESVEIDN